MLEMVAQSLQPDQKFFTSGGFYGELCNKCISITNENQKEVFSILESNSEETDLRIWLHCKYAFGTKKIIYSPDTDVYHIGLPLVHQWDVPNDIYIQQKPGIHEKNTIFVHVKISRSIYERP